MLNYFKCLLLLIALLLLSLNQLFGNQSQQVGRVVGTVVNSEGAVIPNAKIVFQKDGTSWETKTTPDGDYAMELPAGTYEITTEISKWYPLHRARLQVEANATKEITLLPAVWVIAVGLTVTSQGAASDIKEAISPRYDSFIPEKDNVNLNMIVQFYEKEKKGNRNKYSSAILTYNSTTISADELNLNPDDLRFEAVGKVVVEQNGKNYQVQRLKGSFAGSGICLRSTGK